MAGHESTIPLSLVLAFFVCLDRYNTTLVKRRSYNKRYREAHRDSARAHTRAYRAAHLDRERSRTLAYYHSHREEIRVQRQTSRAANLDQMRERGRIRERARYALLRATNPEKLREQSRKYERARYENLRANPERRRAKERRYRAAHLEQVRAKMRAAQRRWARAHPEIHHVKRERRRARKAGAPINNLTHAQWVEIQEAHDHRCVYCHKRYKGHLTQDHLTPLSKGGSHTASNVVPACRSCNSKKYVGAPLIPVQPFLLTLAPAQDKKRRVG